MTWLVVTVATATANPIPAEGWFKGSCRTSYNRRCKERNWQISNLGDICHL